MNRNWTCCFAVCMMLAGFQAFAQEVPETPQPTKEHQWLQQFVGNWKTHSKLMAGPNQPATECEGSMTSKQLGRFWVVNEMKGEFMGQPMGGLQSIGYDPTKKVYVGTWIDSMTHTLWIYQGSVDEAGKSLTLEADGPNLMAEGKTTKFRDAYEFKSSDRIILTSSMLDEQGKWITFMTAELTRTQSASSK